MLNRIAKGNHRELSRTYFQNLGPLPQTLEVNPRHETTMSHFVSHFSQHSAHPGVLHQGGTGQLIRKYGAHDLAAPHSQH